MDSNDLRDLGRQIARDIASGLMQATAAGAAEYCREMQDAARAAEADGLLELADRIEQEKKSLQQQIAAAAGLKRLALQKRLATLEQAEQRMCAEVEKQTPATLPAPEPTLPGPGETIVRRHTRKKHALNGHGE